jgi:hypothetical protein
MLGHSAALLADPLHGGHPLGGISRCLRGLACVGHSSQPSVSAAAQACCLITSQW